MKKFLTLFFTLTLFVLVKPTFADTVNVNFENPPYNLGVINAQDGWSSLGSAGSGCAVYDHAVNSALGTTGFGSQSLRISNAITSGCFGDQTFSKSLINEAGESSAVNNGLSGGTRQTHFEGSFDLSSTVPGAEQPGLFMSVSPDRGDGARMSYLKLEDQADGVHVFFDDYVDAAPLGGPVGDSNGCSAEDDFVESDVATLSRAPHSIKFSMDFVDGPRNDVVKIYIDGTLVHTGTSWEDYFRYCESNPTRPVDSILFRTGGGGLPSAPATAGNGFLVDNLSLRSGPSTVKVILDKYIDGVMATSVTANSSAFPMNATWSADNIGAGSGSYNLSTVGFNSPNPYEAVTSDMTFGADYTTNEVT
ncbi:MAG: hypothetical protein HZC02_00540 [Candidatus Levybacteria bacterium]|nr:hypothetical protein [Candidatus Levybacteria bacterium]